MYDAATVEDARQVRLRAWIDCVTGKITTAELWAVLLKLRAEWGRELYGR